MEKEVEEKVNYVEDGIKKELKIYEDSSATIEYIYPNYNMKICLIFPAVGSITTDEILQFLKHIYIGQLKEKYANQFTANSVK